MSCIKAEHGRNHPIMESEIDHHAISATITARHFKTIIAAKMHAGRLAKKMGGPVDINRSGGSDGHPAWMTPTSEVAAYHRHRFRAARVATRVVEGDEVGRIVDRLVIANAAERMRGTG